MATVPNPTARVRVTARNRARGVQAIAFRANNPKNSQFDANVVGGVGFQTRLTVYVEPGTYTATVLWADGSETAIPIEVIVDRAGRAVPVTKTVTGPAMVPPSQAALDYKRGLGPRPDSFGTPGVGERPWSAPGGGGGGVGGYSRLVKLGGIAVAAYFLKDAV